MKEELQLVRSAGSPEKVSRALIASNNKNKIKELRAVAADFSLELLSPAEVASGLSVTEIPEVEETGKSYYENALLKAQAFSLWSGLPALGDDSGLEVYALDGRPGLHSARYAGEDSSAEKKIAKLLSELENLGAQGFAADRRARFVCTLVLAYPDQSLLWTTASLEGEVLHAPRGEGGFGYDPIVRITALDKTLAEVDFSVTCSSGFRARAAKALFAAHDALA